MLLFDSYIALQVLIIFQHCLPFPLTFWFLELDNKLFIFPFNFDPTIYSKYMFAMLNTLLFYVNSNVQLCYVHY